MAYLPSGTLADVLEHGPVKQERAAALVREIALAVGFAHEQRVVHRDLKPGNILIERDGSPKVADFGLAKQLQSSADLTATGEVLGTPAYMSPEQAAGGSVTAASDIYSLGAILFHLLTGRPPYSGPDAVQVLYQVIHQPAPSIRKLNPRLSIDLATIVERCLARRPQDRPGSALEVAQELQRYLSDEPILGRPVGRMVRLANWGSRHPAIVALILIAFVFLMIGSVASTYFGLMAEQQSRSLAEANNRLAFAELQARRSADEANTQARQAAAQADAAMRVLETTLYDLQAIVVDIPGQQEQRRRLLESVIDGLDQINDASIDSVRLRRCRATAIFGLAEVVAQLGDNGGATGLTAARPLFDEAAATFLSLHQELPTDAKLTFDLAEVLTTYGDHLAEAGLWSEAHAKFQKALPLRRQMAQQSPHDPLIQGRLVNQEILSSEGFLFTGDEKQAGQLLQQACDRSQKLVQQFPNDFYLSGERVHAVRELGDWYVVQNKTAEAERCFKLMMAIAREIADKHPQNSQALMDLSTAFERLGDVNYARGNAQRSLQDYLESLKAGEAAAQLAPANEQLQWELSFAYQKIADRYLSLGDYDQASEYAKHCIAIRQQIAQRDPANLRLHQKLVHAVKTLAKAYERKRDYATAVEQYQRIYEISATYHNNNGETALLNMQNFAEANIRRCQQLQRDLIE